MSAHQAAQIPDHELLRPIGHGSYGEVWLARNVMGTYRAVKVVYRDTFDSARPFEREFSGIQKFEPVSRLHDGLVDILQVGRNDAAGYFYYVMELADDSSAECGVRSAESSERPSISIANSALRTSHSYVPRTLADELERRSRLPFAECLPLFLSLASALGHLHQHGLIHRDIKPSNIIFVNGVAKLADIGLVAEQGQSDSYVGTEGYIPPEGPGTRQADIYSLGKLFYEIATGSDRTKFPTLPVELQDLAASKNLLELNAVFVKACASNLRDRYQSAEEMHADLALLQSGRSVKRLRVVERRLVQATRAGLITAGLFVLASAAYVFTHYQERIAEENLQKAETQRVRAARAEKDATDKLWNAYLAQARATRRTGQAGQRLESLKAVRLAAAIRPSLALRNEAIASLALPDLRAVPLVDGSDRQPQFVAFDEAVERFVRVDANGAIRICRAPDGAPIIELPGTISVSGLYAAFSPNGLFLALYHQHNRLFVWDLTRREVVLQSGPDGTLLSCSFTPDNQFVVSGQKSRQLIFRDLKTSETNRVLKAGVAPDHFSFTRDGLKLVVFSRSSSRGEVLDARDGRLIQQLPHAQAMLAAIWSPEGRWLATECLDGNVFLWNTSTGEKRELQPGYRGGMNDGVFLGEQALVSLSWDGNTRLWDTLTGRQLASVAGAGHYPKFNPNTWRLGWNRYDNDQLELYEVVWPAAVRTFRGSGPKRATQVGFVDFTPDERWLLSGEADGVWCWELSSGRLLAHLPMEEANTILFAPGGTSLVTCAWSGLLRWPIARTASAVEIGPPEPAGPPLRAPQMYVRAALHGSDEIFATSHLGPIRGCRAGTNYTQLAGSEYGTSIAASADGRWIAAGHWNRGGVRVWDAETGGLAREFQTAGSTLVAFTPDSRWLVVGTLDEYAFWDTSSGERGLRIPREKAATIWGPIAFTRDGKLMAIARSRWLVQLLETATGRELASLERPDARGINWLAFSPSGTQLAVASDVIHLWDLRKLRAELAEMNLDWDQPPFPQTNGTTEPAPLRLKVLSASAQQ